MVSMNGDLIKKRLFELGLTREELAAKIKCSSSTINNALAGRRLGEKNVFQLAKALGISAEMLLGKSRERSRERKPA